VLEDGLQQERVPRKPRSRFREVPVELKLARLRQPLRFLYPLSPWTNANTTRPNMTHLDKSRKRGVGALLLLEFVFAVQLVRAIVDKRLEQRHMLLEDVPDLAYDGELLLPLGERVPEAGVGVDDRLQVPEHLRDEVVPVLRGGDDVGILQTLDPDLDKKKKKEERKPSVPPASMSTPNQPSAPP
jgi:hypothetical protein